MLDNLIDGATIVDMSDEGDKMDKQTDLTDFFGPVISTYTRAQALEDGVLVDVDTLNPTMRAECGIKFPIAMTTRLVEEVIKPSKLGQECGQSLNGRLWDALFMLLNAIRLLKVGGGGSEFGRTYRGPGPCQTTEYKVGFTFDRVAKSTLGEGGPFKKTRSPQVTKTLTLKAICGPGDDMEPVITIMMIDED